jgi:PST family polysaccharide transporter
MPEPDPEMLPNQDARSLKRKTVRGALASGAAQGAAFILRTGSMVIMARLLFPEDFGLFGMVVAVTGVLSLFRDFGLSMASVTSVSITHAQISTLFWVNVGVGCLLAVICAVAAPVLVIFYSEPRLLFITVAVGIGFVFLGVGAQPRALLQREMRFGALALIDTLALIVGTAAGIGMAALGQGYWALVVMTISPQIVSAIGVLVASGWLPGRPKRGSGVRSMLWYGGSLTFNGLVVYLAYNIDKILLGRFWGADALGVYGRAYQLINLPNENLTAMVSQVAFPALSRLQNDPERLRSYFTKAYGLFFAFTLPLTAGAALFPADIIVVFLGPRWLDTAPIFRLLAPTAFVFALMNPIGWMLMATGRIGRSVKMALIIAPTVVLGYVLGLSYGPEGVAFGFSSAMVLMAAPLIAWACRGTPVTSADLLRTVLPSLLAIGAGVAASVVAGARVQSIESPFLRLVAESAVLFAVYWSVLLFGFNQWQVVKSVFRELRFSRGEQYLEATPQASA